MQKLLFASFLLAAALALPIGRLYAQDVQESDYYHIEPFAIPEGVVLEASALELLPDNKLAVASRRGEIYLVENPTVEDGTQASFTRFAHGLHEVLGLDTGKDGWLYVTQRCDVSRIRDTDKDGVADVFQVVNDGWDITGDYHEYAFGSKFDRDGNIWVTLCLTGSFNSNALYRGWCVRINSDGKLIPTCSGLRSPGGVGANADGDMFYTDNQGPWNGTCSLKWLRPGSFQGHPGGNRWYSAAESIIGPAPAEPKSGSRIMTEAGRIPEFEPPAVLFPYKKMGQSASGVVCDTTGGKFGPFKGQLFVGDQTYSTVMRCYLEKINGHYQGACFPFRSGFGSGTLSLELSTAGELYVGGTNRGWGSRGTRPFALERLTWTGKTPFEILELKALPDGFEFVFTEPIDAKTAADPQSYKLETYTYIFQSSYGSPEVDHSKPKILDVSVADDRRSVRLKIDGLRPGHVHEFHLDGIQSANQQALLHKEAFYTLNYIPEPEKTRAASN